MIELLIGILWIMCWCLTCVMYKVFSPSHFSKGIAWQRACFFVYFFVGPIGLLFAIIHMFLSEETTLLKSNLDAKNQTTNS